jgi:hypothetical protein
MRFSSKQVVLGSVLLALGVGSCAWAGAPLKVEWKDELLSVIAEEAPLAQILREIARQTGMDIQGIEHSQGDVSVRFSGLPLRDGLRRLLVDMNYAILEFGTFEEGTPTYALFFPQQPSRSQDADGMSGAQREDERAAVEAARQPSSGVQREDEQAAAEAARRPTGGVQREDERAAEARAIRESQPREDEHPASERADPSHGQGSNRGRADAASQQNRGAHADDD